MSKLPTTTTSKKVKIVGYQEYLNVDTGEIVPMAVTDIEDRDFNFSKVWMKNFIATLDLIGNKKTALAFWVIDNLNKENQLIYSYRQIAEQTGLSLDTVSTTMKTLKNADFLRQIGQVYTVNPDIVFKGTRAARIGVLNQYHSEPIKPPTKDEKVKTIKDTISKLQKELDTLLQGENVIDTEINGQLSFDEQGNLYEEAVMVEEPKQKTKRKRKKKETSI